MLLSESREGGGGGGHMEPIFAYLDNLFATAIMLGPLGATFKLVN